MKKSFSLFIIAVLLALLPVSELLAQDRQQSTRHNLKLAFEFGVNWKEFGLEKPERVREKSSADYVYKDNVWLINGYVGIKPEFFILNNRVGIALGLRFTDASTGLVANSSLFNTDSFLWKVKESGITTDYVKIKSISQNAYLLGVPLEIRFFMNNSELPFQSYFKIGTSLNYRIHSENEITFKDDNMKRYDNLVQSQLPTPKEFSSFLYGAIGFKVGKLREGSWTPWGNFELTFPYILLTKNSFTFAKAKEASRENFPGIGFQCSFQIPIGKNVPIGSK